MHVVSGEADCGMQGALETGTPSQWSALLLASHRTLCEVLTSKSQALH
jgi:hypothetical protein